MCYSEACNTTVQAIVRNLRLPTQSKAKQNKIWDLLTESPRKNCQGSLRVPLHLGSWFCSPRAFTAPTLRLHPPPRSFSRAGRCRGRRLGAPLPAGHLPARALSRAPFRVPALTARTPPHRSPTFPPHPRRQPSVPADSAPRVPERAGRRHDVGAPPSRRGNRGRAGRAVPGCARRRRRCRRALPPPPREAPRP